MATIPGPVLWLVRERNASGEARHGVSGESEI